MIFEVNTNKGNLSLEKSDGKLFRLQDGDHLYYDEDTDTITMIHYKSQFRFGQPPTWNWIRVGVKNPKFIHGISKYRSGLDYIKKTMINDITKRVYRDLKLKQLVG